MKLFYVLGFSCSFIVSTLATEIELTKEQALEIGNKIWFNECKGSIEGLTHWNEGEDFPSLGIGHFIWYRQGQNEPFQETFPNVLNFLEKSKVDFPEFLKTLKSCPWTSREEFLKQFHSKEMVSLREFLYKTRDLQAIFITQKLEAAITEILQKSSSQEKDEIQKKYKALCLDPKGVYAMMDYLNFKGSGISSLEQYEGFGWGLKHVLLEMEENNELELVAFVKAAQNVLKRRIEHSPKERNENRWLVGWLSRLNTYLE